jgi:acyl-CoA synthetase (AMP-forming)/AMP-acid ligase II
VGILDQLAARNSGRTREPFLIGPGGSLSYEDVAASAASPGKEIEQIQEGEVVALIGDFDRSTISTMLNLLDRGVILMPLTTGTQADHEYFFDAGRADWIIRDGRVERRVRDQVSTDPLLDEVRSRQHPGIIFFSSGTTGRPKAILHDFQNFLARYAVPRRPLRALNFLLFDHAGGINTMLHTLFNGGVVIVPAGRTPDSIASDMIEHNVELLPATPTFLRMMLLDGNFDSMEFPHLRVVTYGTERMDQGTLDRLCATLPHVDFRQTYGLSELGVFQVRSEARNSLWMEIGGPGIETRVVENVLHIKSANRMLGYLNAPDPFVDGWYNTGDIVETRGNFIRVTGRINEVLNVGGLKILPSEIERVALQYPGVLRAKAVGVPNPITGQHVEVTCEPAEGVVLERRDLALHFRSRLQKQLAPSRIVIGKVAVSHRFKQK